MQGACIVVDHGGGDWHILATVCRPWHQCCWHRCSCCCCWHGCGGRGRDVSAKVVAMPAGPWTESRAPDSPWTGNTRAGPRPISIQVIQNPVGESRCRDSPLAFQASNVSLCDLFGAPNFPLSVFLRRCFAPLLCKMCFLLCGLLGLHMFPCRCSPGHCRASDFAGSILSPSDVFGAPNLSVLTPSESICLRFRCLGLDALAL